ncbi:MAG TPA: SpoIVB peptidase S55 domain-containing protein, partial [Tepidisphaeraceae bacterium]|nr:SpoIVB peptidase S55 domain-containing protein [Tepidisphaeraceae bacterium]
MRLLRAVLIILSLSLVARAAEPKTLFDPARHMRVAEVKPGMKGYGLSVFKGTKIEKFDVEVLSVLKNFNPKYDVILITCKGQNLEHTGAIAGMSGSPIFLNDDQGHARMVGAFAYGWPMVKDPIAGVQPIEYMLKLPADGAPPATQTTSVDSQIKGETQMPAAEPRATWNYFDVVPSPGASHAPSRFPFAKWGSLAPNPALGADLGDAAKLRPLATPLMAGG